MEWGIQILLVKTGEYRCTQTRDKRAGEDTAETALTKREHAQLIGL